RFAGSIHLEEPLPVAASQWFEARPTLAYDGEGRIWVAYEESYRRWGKDFGAHETTGVGLYQGNTVRVKVLEGDQYYSPASPLERVLRALPAVHPRNQKRRPGPWVDQPDPSLAVARGPNTTPYRNSRAHKSHPRLATTPDGTVFLAYRNAMGNIWGPGGTCWYENVVWFDGGRWRGPVFVARSDGILDNRPAMAAMGDSHLLMVGSTDHRFHRSGRVWGGAQSEWINYDLMAHEIAPTSSLGDRLTATAVRRHASPASLRLIEAGQPDPPEPDVATEQKQVALMRDYRAALGETGAQQYQLLRGEFHRHTAVSGDGGSDGDMSDAWRYFIDAAYLDWAGCCDHDNGAGREYTWWWAQKMTDAFHAQGRFVPVFSYERSVRYPEGHRNVIFAERGVRPLPRLPKTADDSAPEPAPDTQMLYEYLRFFDGIAAVHTSGTNMGTDWRDNDPEVEPVVEIYQGDRQNYEMAGAPRTNRRGDSIGGWRPLGFVSEALAKGFRLGFQASSDHISTHMSYCNLWVTEPTREAILEAFKARRIYGATDNILADVRCSGHFMGEEFALEVAPQIDVKLTGTDKFAKVHIIKDNEYVYTAEPGTREVEFSWRDSNFERGKTSYYYVRGEQADGEIVWVSPMWIEVR
ncbi:MAG: hypothetical protein GY953_33135, partial [bacterium]|nr:hypothetical protein [bacterium]